MMKKQPLMDFFEATGEYVPGVHGGTEAVDSAQLYDDAEKTCVLNDRSMESFTYSVENPSRLRLSSKMSEERVKVEVYFMAKMGRPPAENPKMYKVTVRMSAPDYEKLMKYNEVTKQTITEAGR